MTLAAFAQAAAGHLLGPLGFRLKGSTFWRVGLGIQQVASFMRLGRRPLFIVRLQVWLPDFYPEIGVVASVDLASLLRRSRARDWPWPLAEHEAASAEAEIREALTESGIPWLEGLREPSLLARHLESVKRVSAEADAQRVLQSARFEAAGVQVLYQSAGCGAPSAGRLRPDKARHLSYCYELCGAWAEALAAWDDYCGTWETPLPSTHRLAIAHAERRQYLTDQLARQGTGREGT